MEPIDPTLLKKGDVILMFNPDTEEIDLEVEVLENRSKTRFTILMKEVVSGQKFTEELHNFVKDDLFMDLTGRDEKKYLYALK